MASPRVTSRKLKKDLDGYRHDHQVVREANSRMSKTSLETLREKSKRATVEQQLASTRQQLADTVVALERARKVKPQKISISNAKRRGKDDLIRVCIPDTHGAHVDPAAIAAVLGDIKHLQPQEIILLGDHVDCGGFLAQHHVMGYVAETEYTYADDIGAANDFLDALQAAAPSAKITYIEGNHEWRVERWCVTEVLRNRKDAEFLRRAFAPQYLLKLEERGIEFIHSATCYDGLPMPGVIRRGKCFFFHGFSTAKHAVAATQSKIAGNCVFGHTHRAQSDIVRPMGAGVVGSWNPGCLAKLQPMWNHSRPSDWTHGYAIQLVNPSGNFLHLNIPVLDGHSLLTNLINTRT